MSTTAELQISGLGPVGIRMMVAHLSKHADKTHLLKVKGPDGIHDILVKPGRTSQAEAELRRLLTRQQFAGGIYRGASHAV